MNEARFKDLILKTFNGAGNPNAFIWKHNDRYSSGFPDIEWRTPAFRAGVYWELKVYALSTLPADLTKPHPKLCTPIQINILTKLARAGAQACVVVLHIPTIGKKEIWVAPLNRREATQKYSYEDFFRWLGKVPNITWISG